MGHDHVIFKKFDNKQCISTQSPNLSYARVGKRSTCTETSYFAKVNVLIHETKTVSSLYKHVQFSQVHICLLYSDIHRNRRFGNSLLTKVSSEDQSPSHKCMLTRNAGVGLVKHLNAHSLTSWHQKY